MAGCCLSLFLGEITQMRVDFRWFFVSQSRLTFAARSKLIHHVAVEKTPRRTRVEVERTKDITTLESETLAVQRRSPGRKLKGARLSPFDAALLRALPHLSPLFALHADSEIRLATVLASSPFEWLLWDARASRRAAIRRGTLHLSAPSDRESDFSFRFVQFGRKSWTSETRERDWVRTSRASSATDDSISCRSSGPRPFVVCL